MSTFWSFLIFFFFLIEASLSQQFSTISAAPALLPGPSASPEPALSPDISPLFPTPGADTVPPSGSSLPTIPSSPSPPNPDAISAPGPSDLAFPPSGFLPVSPSSPSGPFNLVLGFSFSLLVLVSHM